MADVLSIFGTGDMRALRQYARSRDPVAFERLVHRYQGMVLATCRRVLGSESDAQDAAQETFLTLARHAGDVRSNAAAWLHACAVRHSLDLIRKRSARDNAEEAAARTEAVPAVEPTWRDVESRLDEALSRLEPADRELILMRFLAGRPQRELAAESGVSEGTMSRRLTRALDRLRDQLGACGCVLGASLPRVLEEAPAISVGHEATGSFVKAGLSCLGQGAAAGAGVKVAAVVLLGALTVTGGAALVGMMTGMHSVFASAEPPPQGMRLASIRQDGVPAMELSSDGTTMTLVMNRPTPKSGKIVFTVLSAGPDAKAGEYKVKVESAELEQPDLFKEQVGKVFSMHAECKRDWLTLKIKVPENGAEQLVVWSGIRGVNLPAPKAVAGAVAPEIAGAWLQAQNWDFRMDDAMLGVWDGRQAMHTFKILNSSREGDIIRAEVICNKSEDPAMIGKRMKMLMRRTEAGCDLAVHEPMSPRLQEYPSGFDPEPGEGVIVMRYRKEEP